MQKCLLWVCLTVSYTTIAQVIRFAGGIGYGIITSPGEKKIVLYTENVVGYEFESHKKLYFSVGLGRGTYQYNQTNGTGKTALNKRLVLLLPAMVRHYSPFIKKSMFFFELGPVGNFHLLAQTQSRSPDITAKEKNTGVSIALAGSAGIKMMLIQRIGLECSLNQQWDAWQNFKEKQHDFAANRKLVNISITYVL